MNFHSPHNIHHRHPEEEPETKADKSRRIVQLDFGDGLNRPVREELEFERKAALFDLLENNLFSADQNPPEGHQVTLSCQEGRLIFSNQNNLRLTIALAPLRRIIRDYFLLCESYYDAVKTSPTEGVGKRVEELDHERRAVHNEGAELLMQQLAKKGPIRIDHNTSRRLFTLICVMHMK